MQFSLCVYMYMYITSVHAVVILVNYMYGDSV